MNVCSSVDDITNDLIKRGSTILYLKGLRERSIDFIKKDLDLTEILNSIIDEICAYSYEFLNKRNINDTNIISGFSTGIYLPDYNSGSFKFTLVGGNKSRNESENIDYNTLFDIASITKLYTLILAFKLEELGFINLDDKVSDINPDFKNLGDFTFNDLIRLYGEIRTNGNIALARSYEEAYSIFKSLYIKNDDKNIIKYNDLGPMVIGDTIEKIISLKLGRKVRIDEIMNRYLFRPFGINNTMFNPTSSNVSGNGYSNNTAHDPKSRIFGGISSHAGLFTNSEDLFKLSDILFQGKYLNESHIKRLYKKNIIGASRGDMGLYLKHFDSHAVTYNPDELSVASFTAQGYTGSTATFDLKNKIHNNILVNAIIDDKENSLNDKPLEFLDSFDSYQIELFKSIMLMYVIKTYYNKYLNVKEDYILRRKI